MGIHEGRQGSKNFNVSVYMDNIDAAVRGTFGDEYAAYYFYYMLNFDSERNVSVTGDAPQQLCIRMTAMQAKEFNCVNAYRTDEIGTGMYKTYADYRGDVKLA